MPRNRPTYLVRDFSGADKGKTFIRREMPGIGTVVMVNREVHERALKAANDKLKEVMQRLPCPN